MPFTDEERRRWHEEKRARERAQQPPPWPPAGRCLPPLPQPLRLQCRRDH